MTERKLIEGCIKNDETCQRAIYDKYVHKMMTLCIRYASHRMEAEDILQDGFIKIFENAHKFRFQGSFEGWMRRIIINTALKYYRKNKVIREQAGLEHYENSFSTDAQAVSLLSEEELLQIIGELPPGYKMVFNLYAIEGFNHNEIAEMLGINASTSRSQLVKARKLLQKRVLELHKIRV